MPWKSLASALVIKQSTNKIKQKFKDALIHEYLGWNILY